MNSHIDALAFAPHPDDAELYCAGTLLALKDSGLRIGIVDCTRGELATRGTPELRARESEAASRLLGLDFRENLGIPDGGIENSADHRLRVIRVLRRTRPSLVLLPPPRDRHPDHERCHALLREALFASGLDKLRAEDPQGNPLPPHRPAKAFCYMMTDDVPPALIVDISAAQERKIAALRCYGSQFHTGAKKEGESATFISTPAFMEALEARSRRLGFLIGARYGEGLHPLQPLGLDAAGLFNSCPR